MHALSFDVEEWFEGNALSTPQAEIEGRNRLANQWQRVLELLDAADTRATFFILGSAAETVPDLVKATAEAGHEIASHGFDHTQVHRRDLAEYAEDVRHARMLLQDLSGQAVLGYRAPSWSLRTRNHAAIRALVDAGYGYSSSVFPFHTPLYGEMASTRPWTHHLTDGRHLVELPPAVARIGPFGVPFGGGLYWRVLPGWAIRLLLERSPVPRITYLHPWELDHAVGTLGHAFTWPTRLVLTFRVERTEDLLRRLLADLAFAPIATVFAAHLPAENRELLGAFR
jgi:polysaccharide deacetylase family protein (PEP-CTERM system associated)